MKIALLILSLAFTVLSAQTQQSPTKPPAPAAVPTHSGRYQIAAASAGDPAAPEEKTIFLVDTETGRVWKYQLARTIRNADGKMGYDSYSF